jgi:hypothetical protein
MSGADTLRDFTETARRFFGLMGATLADLERRANHNRIKVRTALGIAFPTLGWARDKVATQR